MQHKTNPNQRAPETLTPNSKLALVKKCFSWAIRIGWTLYRLHKIEEWILSFFSDEG